MQKSDHGEMEVEAGETQRLNVDFASGGSDSIFGPTWSPKHHH